MTEVSAHVCTESRPCKVETCTDEARWALGRLAGLCEKHAEERKRSWAQDAASGADVRREVLAKTATVNGFRKQLQLTLRAEAAVRNAEARGLTVGERRQQRLVDERHKLRVAWLRCGVSLGLISTDGRIQ